MAVSGTAIAAFVGEYGATIAAVSAAAGTAVTVYGQAQAADAAKARGDYDARVSENNAAYAADDAAQRAANIRKVARSDAAAANLQLAGGGVRLGEGSAIDISRTIYQQSELDAMNTLLTGKRNASSSSDEAKLLRSSGDQTARNDYIGIGTTILGAAAKQYGTTGNWRTTSKTSDLAGGYNTAGWVNQGQPGA